MNQVEFLLRLSENDRERGDDIAQRHHDERAAHVKMLQDHWNMIEAARQNVWTELSRFGGLNETQRRDLAETRAQLAGRQTNVVREIPQQKEAAQR